MHAENMQPGWGAARQAPRRGQVCHGRMPGTGGGRLGLGAGAPVAMAVGEAMPGAGALRRTD